MTVQEIQAEILRLKEEQDVCILAHAYQSQPILEIADYVGDSYGLSVQASRSHAKTVIMCGVRFMAETCKILCPDKTVWLPNPSAGCPMAEQLDGDGLEALKEMYPGYAVVAYVNTTASLKAKCDVCVTSSSAVKVCRSMDADKILFIPDPNLGHYVAAQIPEKTFAFYSQGGCPRHMAVTGKDVQAALSAHPDAKLLVHPECRDEVVSLAHYVGSTTEIMAYARKSEAREFLIGTENSIVEHLQFECREKLFYPLSVHMTCQDMRVTTLVDVYNCFAGNGTKDQRHKPTEICHGPEEITISEDLMAGARRCIQRMMEYGG